MRRRERGLAASVEAAIILPVLVLFIGLLITFARVTISQQHLDSAASAGARAASIERTVREAERSAASAIDAGLTSSATSCPARSVSIDAAGLARAVGDPGTVSVTLTCTLSLSDLALPLLPGSITLASTRSAAIDPYRGR